MNDRFVDLVTVYRDVAGQWRWRATAANGRVVADSGQGYVQCSWATKAATEAFPDTAIVVGGNEETS